MINQVCTMDLTFIWRCAEPQYLARRTLESRIGCRHRVNYGNDTWFNEGLSLYKDQSKYLLATTTNINYGTNSRLFLLLPFVIFWLFTVEEDANICSGRVEHLLEGFYFFWSCGGVEGDSFIGRLMELGDSVVEDELSAGVSE